MPSGAGHDAQMLARVCPTSMIFVPSVNGLSHNIAEYTTPADIEAGANVLLQVVLQRAAGIARTHAKGAGRSRRPSVLQPDVQSSNCTVRYAYCPLIGPTNCRRRSQVDGLVEELVGDDVFRLEAVLRRDALAV